MRATFEDLQGELRRAAEVLRRENEREDVDSLDDAVLNLAIAEWLDVQADAGGLRFTAPGRAALVVARKITGGAS